MSQALKGQMTRGAFFMVNLVGYVYTWYINIGQYLKNWVLFSSQVWI